MDNRMKVRDLIAYLSLHADPDAIVVVDNHGDYRAVLQGDISIRDEEDAYVDDEEYTGPVVRISSWS